MLFSYRAGMRKAKIYYLLMFFFMFAATNPVQAQISGLGILGPRSNITLPVMMGCEASTCKQTIMVNGVLREYYLLAPKIPERRKKLDPPPLVIMLHDSSSDSISFARNVLRFNMNQLATKFGFYIVYPQAINNRWNFGPDSNSSADDQAFISALINYFKDDYSINPSRVYVAGMASGGIMAMRLGCDMSNQINSIAVVDAAMPISMAATCRLPKQVNALFIEGRNDAFVPWYGRVMYDLPGFPTPPRLSVPATVEKWALMNKLYVVHQYGLVPTSKPDGSWAYTETIKGKTNQPEVQFITIYQAGHTWPGGGQYLPQNYVGRVSQNLATSAVIWDFFEFHR